MERVVADRYRLLRELGHGGMGVVWLATDEFLGRQVAVKELRPSLGLASKDLEILQRRAIQEARSVARIHHANAVTLYEAIPPSQHDDAVYLIMEFVEGSTLGQLVTREGALPATRVAAFGLQLLDVLEAAHALGIVHRDVKPGNIIIAAGDQVKLTDFGIAYSLGDPRLTRSGVMGTQAYQAPELFESVPITPAVDLWSLGATLYYAAEGRGPFERDSTGATLRAIMLDELPVPRFDDHLATAIRGLLRRDPDKRATLEQTAALLRQVPDVAPEPAADRRQPVTRSPSTRAEGEAGGWNPDAETALRKDAPSFGSTEVLPQDPSPRGHRRLVAIIAAAVIVVAAAVTGGVLAARGAPAHVAGPKPTATTEPPSQIRPTSPLPEEPSALLVAFVNGNGQIQYDSYSTGWHGPDTLPGAPRGDSPVLVSPNGQNVFYIQTNGAVVNDYYQSGWQGPAGVGGTAEAGSSLAYFPGDGSGTHSGVVFVNTKGQLAYDYYASGWHGPYLLPGTPQAGSPIVVSPDGDHVFFIASDGAVVNDYYASGWQGPDSLGGTAEAGSDLAFFDGSANMPASVLFVSASGQLVYDYYDVNNDVNSWKGPDLLPGIPRAGSPLAWSGDGLSAYFIEPGGEVVTDYISDSGWKGPTSTGGTAAPGSALSYAPGNGTAAGIPKLMFVDDYGNLVNDWYSDGGWHGPGQLPDTSP